MWQINTKEGGVAEDHIWLRPHIWEGGARLVGEYDISSVISLADATDPTQSHKIKIEVDYGKITTYINDIIVTYNSPVGTTASGQEMHTGLDIAVAHGMPIYSIMEGTVTFSGWHNLYGNYIDVTDKNGNKSRYAHCSRLLLSAGQEVKLGQAIAEVGSTGTLQALTCTLRFSWAAPE